ncbi:hypothetical protein PoB_004027500 [Plakobranchus ocellatus]|uniref:Uncharacterized protein n=1 Tax=Plakobranchus ocellatus TaxID=259542 RepID=A0AAV4B3W4_9GAST|nr:hypothetical protein PoB_004027500 [Plakobranchus ocellatus]
MNPSPSFDVSEELKLLFNTISEAKNGITLPNVCWNINKPHDSLGEDIIFQLLECCDEALRKDLTRSFRNLTSYDEPTLLGHIKSLAVRQENVMFARLQLQQTSQDRDEPVRAFSARLKGQASVCQCNIPCKCGSQLSYSDQMVRDTLIVGLADEDIHFDVLGQANQEMSLEETIRFIEAKESGKRSAGRINPKPTAVTVAVDAASSTYKQIERRRLQGGPPDRKAITQNQLCGHCGKAGHSSKKQERMNHCPAFNHICNNCNLPQHFENVCRKSKQKQRTSQSNSATAVFETLCSIEQFARTIALDHHVYDFFCDVWEKRASTPQIESTLCGPTRTTTILAVADTGCQSCLASTSFLNQLGLNISHLIPTSMKMRAANQNTIGIVGALILRVTGFTQSLESKTTRQIVYFSHSTDKLFLSMEACRDLGIIPDTFPSIESVMTDSSAMHNDTNNPNEDRCHCPPRQSPPPLPTSLSFPATEKNREKLERCCQ